MEFKNSDDLMKEYREAAQDVPEQFKNSYILGRLESAYKILHDQYSLILKKRKQ